MIEEIEESYDEKFFEEFYEDLESNQKKQGG